MAQVPPVMMPEAEAPPPRKSNTLVWVLLIVGVGGLCLVVMVIAAIVFPVFLQARSAAQKTACLSNVKQAALATIMYTSDHDEKFPIAEHWLDSVEAYSTTKEWSGCPLVLKENPSASGYGFNSKMSGRKFNTPSLSQYILIFESRDTSRNFSGGPDDVVVPGRHNGGSNYAMGDGRAKYGKDGYHMAQMGDPLHNLWDPER